MVDEVKWAYCLAHIFHAACHNLDYAKLEPVQDYLVYKMSINLKIMLRFLLN